MPAHRQGTLRVKHKSTHNFARQHNLITPVYHHEGEVERTLLLFLKKERKRNREKMNLCMIFMTY